MSAQEAWASVKPKWRFNKRKPTVKDVLGTPTVQQILAGETRTTDEPSGVMRTYLAQYDGKTGAPVWATPNCLADPIEKACHVRSDAKRTAALALEEYASDPKFPHADNYESEDEYIDALIEYMVPRTKLEPGPKATEAQLKAALCLHFMMSKVSETAHVDLLLANVAAIGARLDEADALTTTEFERDAAVMDEVCSSTSPSRATRASRRARASCRARARTLRRAAPMKVRHAHSQETTLVSVTAGSEKKKTRAWDTALTECNLAWDDSKALSDVLLERTKRDRDEDGKRVGFDDEVRAAPRRCTHAPIAGLLRG